MPNPIYKLFKVLSEGERESMCQMLVLCLIIEIKKKYLLKNF